MIPMTLAVLKLILFFKIKFVFLGDKHAYPVRQTLLETYQL